jgi:ElaA protein
MEAISMWKAKKFDDLTNDEIYKIMFLRVATFVVEQKRIYQEVDANDRQAIHVFKEDENGQIVAYARIFLINNGQEVTFGRVVTSKAVRGQGVGRELLQQIMGVIAANFPGKVISIEAQLQVKGYYEKGGFVTQGQPFIFESTPHIKMIHEAL